MQFVKRGNSEWANIQYGPSSRKFEVISYTTSPPNLDNVHAFSWAAILLPRIERNDIWDQIIQAPRDAGNNVMPVVLPPIETFLCPSDRDVTSQPDLAGISYSANCGGWDPRDSSGKLQITSNIGDKVENGVMFDAAAYERLPAKPKAPKVRMSSINDGAGTTLLYTENIHKSYDSVTSDGAPAISWLGRWSNTPSSKTHEQAVGFVWVVPANGTSPAQPVGNTVNDQEAINRNTSTGFTFSPDTPRYARPAGSHGDGANVAFCDGHGMFLRQDIDYVVYQQLMTPNGRKCVDAASNNPPSNIIKAFQNAPPLSENSYQ
jgi:prepilin-type processing-associated H-X9-DG protein